MTFSEKLKDARKNAGLTQEQIAEKLCVSRQAVTKWETGKGLPDVENIRAISSLLSVSIDYLLNDDESQMNEIREKIDLDSYHKGNGARSKQDSCAAEKFPDAEHIWALMRTKKLTAKEWIADFVIGAGSVQIFDQLEGLGIAYYLAECAGKQYFICVEKDFITSTALASLYTGNKFERGRYKYKKLYDIKAK